jgi:hypothetical protein
VQAFARVISNAQTSLFAGIWDEELDELGPLLEAASGRGSTPMSPSMASGR